MLVFIVPLAEILHLTFTGQQGLMHLQHRGGIYLQLRTLCI